MVTMLTAAMLVLAPRAAAAQVSSSATAPPAPAAGATAATTADAKACAACHGPDGNSRVPNIPSLAGQPAFFLLNQLILMREGVRRIEVMAAVVTPLTDDRIDALANYFAALEPKASGDAVDPALSERGAPIAARLRCASCHGKDLAGGKIVGRSIAGTPKEKVAAAVTKGMGKMKPVKIDNVDEVAAFVAGAKK